MNALRRFYRGETNIDFARGWKWGIAGSLALLAAGVISLVAQGLNLGIDFRGGTVWELPGNGHGVAETRDLLRPLGEADAKIQTVGDRLRVQSGADDPAKVAEIRGALAERAGIEPAAVDVSTVGPSWGEEITRKAIRALVIFFVVIAVYISWRLEWRMAVGALVAVLHDVLISVGVYSLLRLEVTPATVISFLTILGYSLYDTIVVFDKVLENTPRVTAGNRLTYRGMVNQSTNQVLTRSVNTSLCALLPVVAVLVVGARLLGAVSLEEFGLALLVGLFAGAYSSIFIATPIVVWLKERQPQFREVRERLAGVAAADSPVRTREHVAEPERVRPAAASGTGGGGAGGGVAVGAAGASGRLATAYRSANHPPRPRKKGRRR
ncbi:MAG: protein translocase subunit SecF [Acidimicrobiales bacterium]